jgi:hypothetical protein
MNQINDIFKEYQIGKKNDGFQQSERAEIVKKFVDRLNQERTFAGFNPLKPSVYAIKMADAGLKTNQDLYWFYRYCDDAKSFGKCFWWSLKYGSE